MVDAIERTGGDIGQLREVLLGTIAELVPHGCCPDCESALPSWEKALADHPGNTPAEWTHGKLVDGLRVPVWSYDWEPTNGIHRMTGDPGGQQRFAELLGRFDRRGVLLASGRQVRFCGRRW
ncbi:hypothetical protein E1193_07880 [Micromonospora sp. KC606]|uniref:hypothetical protein n=1 Tax=Micromonospora sp. KC606 TaxID=2530379 RepID=UPI0010518320|nr:hypothetical protein [Micromonospora sp. KC606]TDC83826.1 hypothetical protein E1193_07880 [Micromonospora sp. KC606]